MRLACLNHVAKKKELTGDALRAADIDGKGGVTISDEASELCEQENG